MGNILFGHDSRGLSDVGRIIQPQCLFDAEAQRGMNMF
jgi:hypothetical protein